MVRAMLDADCVLVIWVTDAVSLTLLLGLADEVAMWKRMLREPLGLTLGSVQLPGYLGYLRVPRVSVLCNDVT